MTAGTGSADAAQAAAWRDARAAASRAQVDVHLLVDEDVSLAQEVIRLAWGDQQVPQSNLLRALAHAGANLCAATRDGRPLGVVLGFLGWTDGLHLHSHMTAVVGGEQSRGVGYALKLRQRAECLDAGVREVRWTFDPLIARNAYFNLVKLGVEVIAFRSDFYGPMDDLINAGDSSDRFEVSWVLDSPRVADAVAGRRRQPPPGAEWLAVPSDYEGLRRTDPAQAQCLRIAWREQLQRRTLEPRGAVDWVDGGYSFSTGVPTVAAPPKEGRRG